MNMEEYLSNRTIFNTAEIEPGMFIEVYNQDIMKPDTPPEFVARGVVTKVDTLTIQYSYFNGEKAATGYIHVDDVDKKTYEIEEDNQLNPLAKRFKVFK
jgi:hypothetical protein